MWKLEEVQGDVSTIQGRCLPGITTQCALHASQTSMEVVEELRSLKTLITVQTMHLKSYSGTSL